MKNIIAIFLLCIGHAAFSQSEYFADYRLKRIPEGIGRYFVQVKKKDGLWHRQVWHYPERTIAVEGTYLDEECTQPEGVEKSWHPNRYPKATHSYVNGKANDVWLGWNEEGLLTDSSNYKNGHRTGISYRWHGNGMLADSIHADGNGNSVQVSWDEEGNMNSAGRWVNDTSKNGRWQYFHFNGKPRATEDYQQGKLLKVACYDDKGIALNDCSENEAEFPGGQSGWRRFLERNLDATVPIRNRAPNGMYTISIRFIVGTDGKLMNLQPITKIGYGLEEEALRILKKSPDWIPAKQYGKLVKAYRIQPISFLVQ